MQILCTSALHLAHNEHVICKLPHFLQYSSGISLGGVFCYKEVESFVRSALNSSFNYNKWRAHWMDLW